MNCAFYDKSMKLCTQSEYTCTFKNIIGYRDIANLTRNKNGSVIFKMAAKDKVNQGCQIIFSQGACLQLKKCHLEYNCAISNKYIVDQGGEDDHMHFSYPRWSFNYLNSTENQFSL